LLQWRTKDFSTERFGYEARLEGLKLEAWKAESRVKVRGMEGVANPPERFLPT